MAQYRAKYQEVHSTSVSKWMSSKLDEFAFIVSENITTTH